jgi:hypothetical protein
MIQYETIFTCLEIKNKGTQTDGVTITPNQMSCQLEKAMKGKVSFYSHIG